MMMIDHTCSAAGEFSFGSESSRGSLFWFGPVATSAPEPEDSIISVTVGASARYINRLKSTLLNLRIDDYRDFALLLLVCIRPHY
jgi:hypothetical protein